MSLAADLGHHSGRATPSLHDAPYRQFKEATGRRSTYPSPIPVQTNRATSLGSLVDSDTTVAELNFTKALEARSPATLRAMTCDLESYAAFAGLLAGAGLPASAERLTKWIDHIEDARQRPATIARKLATLATVHGLLGAPSAASSSLVRDAVKGMRRDHAADRRMAGRRLDPQRTAVPPGWRGPHEGPSGPPGPKHLGPFLQRPDRSRAHGGDSGAAGERHLCRGRCRADGCCRAGHHPQASVGVGRPGPGRSHRRGSGAGARCAEHAFLARRSYPGSGKTQVRSLRRCAGPRSGRPCAMVGGSLPHPMRPIVCWQAAEVD